MSISLKNSKIILKNGSHPICGESEIEEWFVSRMPYEKIVISGKGYISTEAMSVLSEHNLHVILVNTYGNPLSQKLLSKQEKQLLKILLLEKANVA